MADTFTAYSPNGTTTDVNGYQVPAFASQGSTPGKIQSRQREGDAGARMVMVGGVMRPLLEGGLHIPISAPVPVAGDKGVGWEYLCTAVGADSDAALANRRWLVYSVPAKTFATARRLDVVEVTA